MIGFLRSLIFGVDVYNHSYFLNFKVSISYLLFISLFLCFTIFLCCPDLLCWSYSSFPFIYLLQRVQVNFFHSPIIFTCPQCQIFQMSCGASPPWIDPNPYLSIFQIISIAFCLTWVSNLWRISPQPVISRMKKLLVISLDPKSLFLIQVICLLAYWQVDTISYSLHFSNTYEWLPNSHDTRYLFTYQYSFSQLSATSGGTSIFSYFTQLLNSLYPIDCSTPPRFSLEFCKNRWTLTISVNPLISSISLILLVIIVLNYSLSSFLIQNTMVFQFLSLYVGSWQDRLGFLKVVKYLFRQLEILCSSFLWILAARIGSIWVKSSYLSGPVIFEDFSFIANISSFLAAGTSVSSDSDWSAPISLSNSKDSMQQFVPPTITGLFPSSCNRSKIVLEYWQYLFLLNPCWSRWMRSIMWCFALPCSYFVALAVMMSAWRQSCMESQLMISVLRDQASSRLSLVLPTDVVPTMKILQLLFIILQSWVTLIINYQPGMESEDQQRMEELEQEELKIKEYLKTLPYDVILRQRMESEREALYQQQGEKIKLKRGGRDREQGRKGKGKVQGEGGQERMRDKNTPIERSAKIKVNRFVRVFDDKKRQPVDPRFEDYAGTYNPDAAKKAFNFIPELQEHQKSVLKKSLYSKKSKLTQDQRQILVQRYNEVTNDVQLNKHRELQQQVNKQYRADISTQLKEGKTPFFKRKAIKKDDIGKKRFEGMSQYQRNKYVEGKEIKTRINFDNRKASYQRNQAGRRERRDEQQ